MNDQIDAPLYSQVQKGQVNQANRSLVITNRTTNADSLVYCDPSEMSSLDFLGLQATGLLVIRRGRK